MSSTTWHAPPELLATYAAGGLAAVLGASLERHLDQIERTFLLEALKKADGVKTRAAELLGLTFRSFRYRLAKHGLGDGD